MRAVCHLVAEKEGDVAKIEGEVAKMRKTVAKSANLLAKKKCIILEAAGDRNDRKGF